MILPWHLPLPRPFRPKFSSYLSKPEHTSSLLPASSMNQKGRGCWRCSMARKERHTERALCASHGPLDSTHILSSRHPPKRTNIESFHLFVGACFLFRFDFVLFICSSRGAEQFLQGQSCSALAWTGRGVLQLNRKSLSKNNSNNNNNNYCPTCNCSVLSPRHPLFLP